jgi:hypothetical protein
MRFLCFDEALLLGFMVYAHLIPKKIVEADQSLRLEAIAMRNAHTIA